MNGGIACGLSTITAISTSQFHNLFNLNNREIWIMLCCYGNTDHLQNKPKKR
jgi:hypothetical protein